MIIKGTYVKIPDSLIVDILYLRGTRVTELPAGLTVNGWLDLVGSTITMLPEGLTVGTLYLDNTKIRELPDDLKVDCIHTSKKLIACSELQIRLIKLNKHTLNMLKDPTDSAIRLHEMLWMI